MSADGPPQSRASPQPGSPIGRVICDSGAKRSWFAKTLTLFNRKKANGRAGAANGTGMSYSEEAVTVFYVCNTDNEVLAVLPRGVLSDDTP